MPHSSPEIVIGRGGHATTRKRSHGLGESGQGDSLHRSKRVPRAQREAARERGQRGMARHQNPRQRGPQPKRGSPRPLRNTHGGSLVTAGGLAQKMSEGPTRGRDVALRTPALQTASKPTLSPTSLASG